KAVGLVDGWAAGLAFSLQIFFDFSGYSDMAMGLGLMLGLMLPVNFLAPYRATSIREFWRRWHITLSRFLRDYLYIPLGGNRAGPRRRAAATVVTMLLGGLWHGAGWTFVAWGGLHGVALAVNQRWSETGRRCPALAGWLLTMLVVVVGFVLFRATGFGAAATMLGGMAGFGGLDAVLGGSAWSLIMAAGLVAVFGPAAHQVAVEKLNPQPLLAVAVGLGFVYLLLEIGGGRNTEFIYFQF
ncbi:partial Peptidoglycan O-acetyltransferase, partial [Anaerolineae bacterium]